MASLFQWLMALLNPTDPEAGQGVSIADQRGDRCPEFPSLREIDREGLHSLVGQPVVYR